MRKFACATREKGGRGERVSGKVQRRLDPQARRGVTSCIGVMGTHHGACTRHQRTIFHTSTHKRLTSNVISRPSARRVILKR